MLISNWQDYKIIKASNGQKLEKWNNIKLLRPDPIVMWNIGDILENECDAVYYRSNTGGGYWKNIKSIPAYWQIKYNDLVFNIKQMGFKHTGLFPEQAVNWERMIKKIKESGRKDVKVLNLFAYTGGATVACLSAGASVVHVDSSKGINDWAKENVKSSGFENRPVRFLVDDVKKFVQREIRRGNKYDAIIMDPPSYGRGSNNEVWSIEKDLDGLLQSCKEILNDNFLFVCVNTYTANLSLLTLENILKVHFNNNIKVDEIALPIENSNLYLPCGITGWITND
ncbi:MAG: class I SAM-dependent methyltransferase [Mycoplasma sp.]|jgi:23S rRNA (cytosine1962-C5)-methyltransferase|nr:class I SAM-dependent methyltransferase [Mycoplasma sp.]MDD7150109.1 class I SAM-dependent methyltransferase [Mycoplasma sp.]MDY4544352.1 class I SAM-dependent methyltransferase [Bacilli bacterium]MDY4619420.1 class I SAM-dependent methyltransferase [Bacilli bacterium]CDE37824.1 sAM-dependent methyltransferase [Mycoplasma sp. CAG:472]